MAIRTKNDRTNTSKYANRPTKYRAGTNQGKYQNTWSTDLTNNTMGAIIQNDDRKTERIHS